MCVLSIKVSIRKKSGNLFNDPCIFNDSKELLLVFIKGHSKSNTS